jgi:hypothetical protein
LEIEAGIKIQNLHRRNVARQALLTIARKTYEAVFDPSTKHYFYHNSKTSSSSWAPPAFLHSEPLNPEFIVAANKLQSSFKKKQARKMLADMSKKFFEKCYDPDSKEYYYVRRMDGKVRWDKPKLIAAGDDAELGKDSKVLVARDEEILKLKALLAEKEEEIKRTEIATVSSSSSSDVSIRRERANILFFSSKER